MGIVAVRGDEHGDGRTATGFNFVLVPRSRLNRVPDNFARWATLFNFIHIKRVLDKRRRPTRGLLGSFTLVPVADLMQTLSVVKDVSFHRDVQALEKP